MIIQPGATRALVVVCDEPTDRMTDHAVEWDWSHPDVSFGKRSLPIVKADSIGHSAIERMGWQLHVTNTSTEVPLVGSLVGVCERES